MNVRQFVPRIDCKKFAKCETKSLAHCRQYRGTAEDCAGCTLIRRKPRNRMITNDGKELKLCSHCGRHLPLFRFYECRIERNGKTYQILTSWCKQCMSSVNNERAKKKSNENPHHKNRTHLLERFQ